MRFVVVGSIVFAVLAVLAAQWGWFDSAATVAVAGASPPPAVSRAAEPRTHQGDEAEDGSEAAAEAADEAAQPTTGPLEVTVTRAPEGSARPEGTEEVDVEAAPTEDAEEPMAGVTVRVDCEHQKLSGKTGPDGKAHFAAVPTESCTLVVREPGMAVEVRPIAGGEDAEEQVVLMPEARLVVKVRDGQGRPVPGAHLRFSPMDGNPAGPLFAELAPQALVPSAPPAPEAAEGEAPARDESDVMTPSMEGVDSAAELVVPASGELSLSGLSPMMYMLTASAAGYTFTHTEVGLTSGAVRELKVVLERQAALTVRLSGLDDLERARVTWGGGEESLDGASEATLDPDGAFRCAQVPPGVGRLSVYVDEMEVFGEAVAVAPGAEVQRNVRLNLADIDVEVTRPPLPSACAPAGALVGACHAEAMAGVTLACAGDLYRTVLPVGNVAHFPLMPVGVRCDAVLTNRPLGAHVAVTAPGRATLDASRRVLRFTVAGQDPARARGLGGSQLVFTLTDLSDGTRAQHLAGMGGAEVEGVAPGRYQVHGWAGTQALAATVDVTGAPEQLITLRPVEPVCFRAQVVDGTSGEPTAADFVGYQRTAHGLTAVADDSRPQPGGGICFASAGVARLVVSAPGYKTQSFEPRADLGIIRLVPAAEPSLTLTENLRVDDDGAVMVASATRYGLRPGDRLLAIDGQRVDGLVYEEVLSRLSGEGHQPVRLTVKSVDGEREVEADSEGP